jgi:hypothetical protein
MHAEASSPLGAFGVLDTGSLFHLLSALDGGSLVRLGACRCVVSVGATTHFRGAPLISAARGACRPVVPEQPDTTSDTHLTLVGRRLARRSTALHAVCLPDTSLWKRVMERDFAAVLPHVRAHLARPGANDTSFRPRHPLVAQYATARQLASLSTAAWTQPVSAFRLRAHSFAPREGSSLAQLTAGSVLIIGGWTNMGLANDVMCMRTVVAQGHSRIPPLDAQGPRRVPTMECSPCRSVGMSMPPRYGHSATAVRAVPPGSAPDAAPLPCVVIHGGMMSGGYTGEMEDTWLLYPDANSVAEAQQKQMEPGWEATALWRWKRLDPPERTPIPPARGYHAACASPDGTRVYIFGGIADQESLGDGWVLDTRDWTWSRLASATPVMPDARFGASMLFLPATDPHTLWLFGGSDGADLLRDGDDKMDVWALDTRTAEWKQVQPANTAPFPRNLGRCHTAVAVGTKVLFFGGSCLTSRSVSWFCTQSLTFGAPLLAKCLAVGVTDGNASLHNYDSAASFLQMDTATAATGWLSLPSVHAASPSTVDRVGVAPTSRLTHLAALLDGTRMLLTCGWQRGPSSRGCVNDVWLLDLAPARGSQVRAKPQQPEPFEEAWVEDEDDDGDFLEDEEDEDFIMDEEDDEEDMLAGLQQYQEDIDGEVPMMFDSDDEEEDGMAEDPEEWADARVAAGDDEDDSGAEEEAGASDGAAPGEEPSADVETAADAE